MSRGNRKAAIFDDDADREHLLETLNRSVLRYGAHCYAFCLMRNHYHLVIRTPRGNLSQFMRHLNGVYTQASNRRYERSGHLLEGRFRSLIVESDSYLRHVARYVVLNPVRAGLVQHASAWRWSSYRATAGMELPPACLDVDWLTFAFGGHSKQEAQLRYQLFVQEAPLESVDLHADGLIAGTPEFEAALRKAIDNERRSGPTPRAWRALARPTLRELFDIAGTSKTGRNDAIRQAHEVYGYRLQEVATLLGLHPSTVSRALRRRTH